MGVRIVHDLHEFANDLDKIRVAFPRRMGSQVREVAQDGRKHAQRTARVTAGVHGKRYPAAITDERVGPLSWEWGPDAAKPQGGMDFENGSGRQTTPHKNVARGADAHGAGDLARKTNRVLDEMFWL